MTFFDRIRNTASASPLLFLCAGRQTFVCGVVPGRTAVLGVLLVLRVEVVDRVRHDVPA